MLILLPLSYEHQGKEEDHGLNGGVVATVML